MIYDQGELNNMRNNLSRATIWSLRKEVTQRSWMSGASGHLGCRQISMTGGKDSPLRPFPGENQMATNEMKGLGKENNIRQCSRRGGISETSRIMSYTSWLIFFSSRWCDCWYMVKWGCPASSSVRRPLAMCRCSLTAPPHSCVIFLSIYLSLCLVGCP